MSHASIASVASYLRSVGLYSGEASANMAVDDHFNFLRERVPGETNPRRFALGRLVPRETVGSYADASSRLAQFFDSGTRDPDADTLIVWLSGSGSDRDGSLQLPGGRISFEDVSKLWAKKRPSRRSMLLVLVVDCCHSGWWVEKAREKNMCDVVVQSSCSRRETSLEGAFAKWWKALQLRDVHPLEALEALRLLEMHPQTYTPWEEWAPEQILNVRGSPIWPLSTRAAAAYSNEDVVGGGGTDSGAKIRDISVSLVSSPVRVPALDNGGLAGSSSRSLPYVPTPKPLRKSLTRDVGRRFNGRWRFQTHTKATSLGLFVGISQAVQNAIVRKKLQVSMWIVGAQLQMEMTYPTSEAEKAARSSSFVLEVSESSGDGVTSSIRSPSSVAREYAADEFFGLKCVSRVLCDGDAILVHRVIKASGIQIWSRYTATDDGETLLEEQNAVARSGAGATATMIYRRVKGARRTSGDAP